MSVFHKRESLVQNIAYMGIMTAINVIGIIIMNFVPIMFLPFALFMPLSSTVVTLFCKKRYFPIYALATVGLCFLASINNISDTLFYVIPSIISGFAFGMLITYKFPSAVSIFVTGILYSAFSYAVIPLIQLIYGQDMIYVVASIFKLNDYEYLNYVVPSFILVIGLIQSIITYVIIVNEIPKLGIDEVEMDIPYLYEAIGIIGSILSFISYFVLKDFCLFFLAFSIYFGVFEVFNHGVNKNKTLLIIDAVSVVIFILLFALLYQYMKAPLGLVLMNILFDMFLIEGLIYNTLMKKDKPIE